MATIKKFIDKHRKDLILFFLFFTIYFIIGLIISYYIDISYYWDRSIFNLDAQRAFYDLTKMNDYSHYRIKVHPLLLITIQPLLWLINFVLKDELLSIIFLQALLASFSVILVNKILTKFIKNKNAILFFTFVFGLSWSQIILSGTIETYIYAQFFLLLLWIFAVNKIDVKLNYWDYIILVLLGIGSIAITITNIFQFIIVLFFAIFCNKNIQHRFFTSLSIFSIVISFSVFLATIQSIIWNPAPNFFVKNIYDVINNESEEALYIDKNIDMNNVMRVINSTFAYENNIFKIQLTNDGKDINFAPNIISTGFSILMFITFIGLNIAYLKKIKFKIFNYKIYLAMMITLIFNMVLHLFYGNEAPFIYLCHFNFLIIFIIGYILDKLKIFENKLIINCLLALVIILFIINYLLLFKKILTSFPALRYIRIRSIIILFISISSMILLQFKAKFFKFISIILVGFLCYFGMVKANEFNNINSIQIIA